MENRAIKKLYSMDEAGQDAVSEKIAEVVSDSPVVEAVQDRVLIEKIEDGIALVTDVESGDQAIADMTGEEVVFTELDSEKKEFSDSDRYIILLNKSVKGSNWVSAGEDAIAKYKNEGTYHSHRKDEKDEDTKKYISDWEAKGKEKKSFCEVGEACKFGDLDCTVVADADEDGMVTVKIGEETQKVKAEKLTFSNKEEWGVMDSHGELVIEGLATREEAKTKADARTESTGKKHKVTPISGVKNFSEDAEKENEEAEEEETEEAKIAADEAANAAKEASDLADKAAKEAAEADEVSKAKVDPSKEDEDENEEESEKKTFSANSNPSVAGSRIGRFIG